MNDISDVNFHLGKIIDLKQSNDPQDIIACLNHYKAVVNLTGDLSRGMIAIFLAKKNKLDLPKWAIEAFRDQITYEQNQPFPPSVVTVNQIALLRQLRKRRDNLNYIITLLDKKVLLETEFGSARQQIKRLNRYWINGGNEGTAENPFMPEPPLSLF